MKTTKKLWLFILLVGLLTSFLVGWQRHQIEQANKTVEIVFDYSDAVALAQTQGYDLDRVLLKLKQAGVVSLAVGEKTLEDLEKMGQLGVLSDSEVASIHLLTGLSSRSASQFTGTETYLFTYNRDVYQQLKESMSRKLGKGKIEDQSRGRNYILRVMMPEDQIKELPLFLPQEELAKAKGLGFKVVPRFGNYSRVDASGVAGSFAQLDSYDNISTVIFQGEEVLGYTLGDNYLAKTKEKMLQRNLLLGLIEFNEQKGLTSLARQLSYQAVRVHSIPTEEMEKITVDTALARWTRGAVERNVRVLYVRPFLSGKNLQGKDPLAVNVKYVGEIKNGLEKAGFKLGQAQPFNKYQVGLIPLLLLSLGVLAGALMLWKSYFPRPIISEYLLFSLAFLGVLGLVFTGHVYQAKKLLALGAAITFPTLGVIKLLEDWRRRGRNLGPFLSLLKAGAYSLLGGLFVASLLADTSFFLKIDGFSGVKLIHLIPLILVTLYYFLLFERKRGKRIWEVVIDWLNQPVLVKYILFFLVLGAMAFIYITRTGNTGGLPVSGLEIKARQFLEDLLVARPRTKEFLLGHPALMLGAALAMTKNYLYLFPVVLLGAIGQISIVSTFTHIHTPLFISLLRSFNGLILGAILGTIVVGLYKLWIKRGEDR